MKVPRTITIGDLTKRLILLVLMGFYTYLIYSYFAPQNLFEGLTDDTAISETPSNASSLDDASAMSGALSIMKSKNENITPKPTVEPTTPAPSYDEAMAKLNEPPPDPLCSKTDCDYITEILDKGVNLDISGVYFKDGKRDCTRAKCDVIQNIHKTMTPMDTSGQYFLSSGGSVFRSDGKKV
jgi:hypothetical protein